jgi:hypothetical protein
MTRTSREPTLAFESMNKTTHNLLWSALEWVSSKRYSCYQPLWIRVTESDEDGIFYEGVWSRLELTWQGKIWEAIEEWITDRVVPF